LVDLLDASDILYVPIPATSEEDFHELVAEAKGRTLGIIDFNIDLEKTRH